MPNLLKEMSPDAPRTALLRIRRTADLEQATRAISELGATIQSAGRGVITVVANREQLDSLRDLPFVMDVKSPRVFQTSYW